MTNPNPKSIMTADLGGDAPPPADKKADATPPADKKDDGKGDPPPPPADDKAKGEKPKRPDSIPEKFWDADKGALNTEGLLKSYGELETEAGRLRAKEQPPKDGYVVTIPEKYKDKAEIPADDPMWNAYVAHAKKMGYSQERVNQNLEFFIDFMWNEHENGFNKEIEKLGGAAKANERVQSLKNWAKNNLDERGQKLMDEVGTSAAAIELMSMMMAKASIQVNPPEEGADGGKKEDLTEAALTAKMKDERYWNPAKRDSAFVQEVTEGFQKLYPKGKG